MFTPSDRRSWRLSEAFSPKKFTIDIGPAKKALLLRMLYPPPSNNGILSNLLQHELLRTHPVTVADEGLFRDPRIPEKKKTNPLGDR